MILNVNMSVLSLHKKEGLIFKSHKVKKTSLMTYSNGPFLMIDLIECEASGVVKVA